MSRKDTILILLDALEDIADMSAMKTEGDTVMKIRDKCRELIIRYRGEYPRCKDVQGRKDEDRS